MNGIEALLLGLLQGFTEFLPVSSSGHLLIGKALFGVETPGVTFEIMVHCATVLSTIVVFWKTLVTMGADALHFRKTESTRLLMRILLSLVPVMVVGFFFKDKVEALFGEGLGLVGAMLLLTAALLALSQYLSTRENRKVRGISYWDALLIGVAQALAVLPGLSRSGSTISTGLCLGNRKEQVASFSFLMVLIPVLGETLLEILDGGFAPAASQIPITSLLIGFVAAFVSGLIACKWMIALVKRVKFTWFALYCALAGVACLIFA